MLYLSSLIIDMIDIIVLLLGSMVVETLTELFVKSDFFFPLRDFIFRRSNHKLFYFFSELLDCGYCTSVWIGFITAIIFINLNVIKFIGNGFLDWFMLGLLFHRFSNIIHFIVDRVNKDSDHD